MVMTKKEFDLLRADGKEICPECGLRGFTTPHPGCECPLVKVRPGMHFTKHINKWHHDCEDAKRRAEEKCGKQ